MDEFEELLANSGDPHVLAQAYLTNYICTIKKVAM